MLPVFLNFPYITIYTYGVFLLLGLLWGLFFIWKNTHETTVQEPKLFDSLFISFFIALIVGRIIFFFLYRPYFVANGWTSIISIHLYPGLEMNTSIGIFILSLMLLLQYNKMHILSTIDLITQGLTICLVFERIGAFFAGVVIGTPTQFMFRVLYQYAEGYRHITGLYMAIYYMVLYLLLHLLVVQTYKNKHFKGIPTFFWLWAFFNAQLIFLPLTASVIPIQSVVPNHPIILSAIGVLTSLILLLYYIAIIFIRKTWIKNFLKNKNKNLLKPEKL